MSENTVTPGRQLAVSHQPFEVRSLMGGTQVVFRFANGFGASVVRHWGSYGSEAGFWELAVTELDGDDWELTYDTEITDNVIGHLNPAEVDEYLTRINNLDAYGKEQRAVSS